nr:MAG TPA: hypothetical protein [Caudoviricetes sp.]
MNAELYAIDSFGFPEEKGGTWELHLEKPCKR